MVPAVKPKEEGLVAKSDFLFFVFVEVWLRCREIEVYFLFDSNKKFMNAAQPWKQFHIFRETFHGKCLENKNKSPIFASENKTDIV